MKKLLLGIIVGIFFTSAAQKDSSEKFRLSGVQVSGGMILSGPYKSLTLDDYKSFVKEDPILYRDLSGFYGSSYSGPQFMGGFSIRVYANLRQKRKHGREVFFGIKTCDDYNSSLSYSKSESQVIDIYVSQNGNTSLYKVKEKRYYYSYDLYSTHTYLQLGYSLCTSKDHWAWFTAGFELAPGLSSNFRYMSSESTNTVEGIVIPNPSNGKGDLNYDYTTQISQGTASTRNLSGIGFAMYSALPFSANVRFGKRKPILRNLNFSATLNPLASYSSDRYMGSSLKFGISAELGLRVNW